jgi:hypothetical protein
LVNDRSDCVLDAAAYDVGLTRDITAHVAQLLVGVLAQVANLTLKARAVALDLALDAGAGLTDLALSLRASNASAVLNLLELLLGALTAADLGAQLFDRVNDRVTGDENGTDLKVSGTLYA